MNEIICLTSGVMLGRHMVKACPDCGALEVPDVERKGIADGGEVSIICGVCGWRTGWNDTVGAAAHEWNMSTVCDPTDAELEPEPEPSRTIDPSQIPTLAPSRKPTQKPANKRNEVQEPVAKPHAINGELPKPGTVIYPVHVTTADGSTKTVTPNVPAAEDVSWNGGMQTHGKRAGRKPNSERIKDPDNSIHGTYAGVKAGCRCEKCRKAMKW